MTLLQTFLKSGSKDPKQWADLAPSNPAIQPDQAQFLEQIGAEYGATHPMPEAVRNARQSYTARKTIRVEYSAFIIEGTFTFPTPASTITIPQLLVPRNPNRSSLIVIPLLSGGQFFGFNNDIDALMHSKGVDQITFNGGIVPINDLWVASGDVLGFCRIMAYEGTAVLAQE